MLDDSHNDGEETLTLTLSNASSAAIKPLPVVVSSAVASGHVWATPSCAAARLDGASVRPSRALRFRASCKISSARPENGTR